MPDDCTCECVGGPVRPPSVSYTISGLSDGDGCDRCTDYNRAAAAPWSLDHYHDSRPDQETCDDLPGAPDWCYGCLNPSDSTSWEVRIWIFENNGQCHLRAELVLDPDGASSQTIAWESSPEEAPLSNGATLQWVPEQYENETCLVAENSTMQVSW